MKDEKHNSLEKNTEQCKKKNKLVNDFVMDSISSDSVIVTILIKNKLSIGLTYKEKKNRCKRGVPMFIWVVILRVRKRS